MAVKYSSPLSGPELNNETNFFVAGAAGIASGIIKIPEGVVSLAAELIDLGAGTDVAADVEKFFDKINPFEEIADDRAIGKLTEALIQIGVPGAAGFKTATKLADKALKAKRSGNYANLKNPNLQKAVKKAGELNQAGKTKRFAAGVVGGAAGETLVADVENIGTFGDLFGGGPTELQEETGFEDNRGEALRKLMNRVKFGSESLAITPFVYGVGTGAKALAQRGKDLAYSNSQFERFVDKIGSTFRARGAKPQEIFEAKMKEFGRKSRDANRATELVKGIDRNVDEMFGGVQGVFDKSTRVEKDKFLGQVNELLFSGNLRGRMDQSLRNTILKTMKKKGITEENQQLLMQSLTGARKEFAGLLDLTAKSPGVGKTESKVKNLEEIMGDRVKQYLGNTYKIFEDKSIIPFANYKPTDQAINNAMKIFKRYGKKATGKRLTNQEARYMVDKVLQTARQSNPKTQLPRFKYTNLTQGATNPETFKNFVRTVEKGRYFTDRGGPTVIGQGSKAFRELFGKIEDPRYSIYNGMTKISAMARKNQLFGEITQMNDDLIKQGKRGFFFDDELKAARALPNQDIVKLDSYLDPLVKDGNLVNPLKGYYTTKSIAEGLGNADKVSKLVRGEREGANIAERGISWLWRNLLLYPKGISQISKTVLSIPTHLRNFFSAGAFAGANGVLFENPALVAKSFKDAFGPLQVGTRSAAGNKRYQELLELGVVNSQVQIGDLKNLLKDVKFGETVQNMDGILKPMINKFKNVGKTFQDLYVAEDDVWKITNFAVERNRLQNAYAKAKLKPSAKALDEEAANIVRNTVPNYAYVSDFVRAMRAIPFGNFMSFPSEIFRTTTNIAKRGLSEIRDPITGKINPLTSTNPLKAVGMKRLAGMATTLAVVPYTAQKGAQALYNVTNEQLEALKKFVPEWSKNSVILPVRDEDTGKLKYIDFSHSNAYDTVARPYLTLLNNIQAGIDNEEVLMKGFVKGVQEAAGEVADPFISESIFTEALFDLTTRGGRTADGRELYTDETPAGDKIDIQIRHLAKALLPSMRQYERLTKAGLDIPGKRGEKYELPDEVLGFAGFRPVPVDPIKSMGFKISEYQDGIRNARKEFTGGAFGVLSGGQKTPQQVLDRYIASNQARFKVQKKMYEDLKAAEILGTEDSELFGEFRDRQISARTYNALSQGMFDPYYPSRGVISKFQEIADDLGGINPFMEIQPIINDLYQDLNGLSLDMDFEIEEGYEDIEEFISQVPPLPQQPQPVVQSPVLTGQINPQTRLTQTETALLSPMEQLIRQRSRT